MEHRNWIIPLLILLILPVIAHGQPIAISSTVQNATEDGGFYNIRETDTAVFVLQLNQEADLEWSVNGAATQTTSGDRHRFSWNPGMFYMDNSKQTTVTATANGTVIASFSAIVHNDINPFWEDGADQGTARIVVVTSNARNYTAIKAQISDMNGAKSIELSPSPSGQDTTWSANVATVKGTTIITSISASTTEHTVDYALTEERSHYCSRNCATPEVKFKNEGRSSSSSRELNRPSKLIYAVFDKDVINKSEQVIITADTIDQKGVASVTARMSDENGKVSNIPLEFMKGTATYGTWSAIITTEEPDIHTLEQIMIMNENMLLTTVNLTDRAFYVQTERDTEIQPLRDCDIVYSMLDQNSIIEGQEVLLRLDARDEEGVTAVSATLVGGNDTQTITLQRVAGTAQYGTWEGTVKLENAGLTYKWSTTSVADSTHVRTVQVYGQKVYVQERVESAQSQSLNGPQEFKQFMRDESTPLYIGLSGMAMSMLMALGIMRKEDAL